MTVEMRPSELLAKHLLIYGVCGPCLTMRQIPLADAVELHSRLHIPEWHALFRM